MSNTNSDNSATDEYDIYPNVNPEPDSIIITINESNVPPTESKVNTLNNSDTVDQNVDNESNEGSMSDEGSVGTTTSSEGQNGINSSESRAGLKKIRKKKRKVLHETEKKPKDKCLFCHGRISEEDKYFPCNCRFGFVHRECLRQWAFVDGHLYCQVCKLRYHLERQNGVCFVCSSANQEKPLIKPCKCLYITVHTDCINEWYTRSNNNHKCKYCDYEYKIVTQVSRKFTKSRIPFILWSLGIIAYLLFAAFLIGGTDIITAINPDIQYQQFNYTFNGTTPYRTSRILFPSNITDACYVMEIMYFVLLGIGTLVAVSCFTAWIIMIIISLVKKTDQDHEYITKNKTWIYNKRFYLFFGPLITIPLLHFLGNIHYLIYIKLELITPINSFWMYNINSFLSGPAGLIVFAVAFGVCVLLYMIAKAIYWLMIKENRQIEVVIPDVVGF